MIRNVSIVILAIATMAPVGAVIPQSVHAGTIYRCQEAGERPRYTTTWTEGCVPLERYRDFAPPAVVAPLADDKPHAIYRQIVDGVAHYSATRPPDGPVATVVLTYIAHCYACETDDRIDFARIPLNQTSFRTEIDEAARRERIDPALLRAVIHAESAFNAKALSGKGAQGLMQLMPATAARFGVVDAFVPSDNIRAGAMYMAWLLKRYGGRVTLATAAYNAGEAAVDRYGGVPPFAETRDYVKRVSILLDRYRVAASLQ